MPDGYQRVKEVFQEAAQLEPPERSAYLDAVCGRDTALRSAVESLLAAEQGAGSFLERSPPGLSPEQNASLQSTITRDSHPVEPSQTIDRYRLLEKLGAGGMGEVWLAEQQEPVRRRVALKVIKAGMDTAQVIARFEAERQALALMDHPAIAKIFDAGATPTGRPYFVMEHVAGLPITQHCDQRRLSTRDRLELFVQVCEGVQHAHQKAVLHRDLKPTNVLVVLQDGRAAPRIIDFGVAKATAQPLTAHTLNTGVGMLIGTPGYMSPEQADFTGQDVDTRTDVYSLGVMLYELLVGVLPYDERRLREAGCMGLARLLRNEEPLTPSRRLTTLDQKASAEAAGLRQTDVKVLRRQLSGDLDWITMKALEHDRGRRYASPAELAEDIDRHLRDEPVLAGPPGAAYRTGKYVRRHRMGVVVASFLTLTVAGAVALGAAVRLGWLAPKGAGPGLQLRQRQLTSNPAENALRDAAISPDGRHLAYLDQTGIWLRDVDGQEVRRLELPEGFSPEAVDWFPNGTKLLVLRSAGPGEDNPSLWTASILGGAPRKLRDDVYEFSISPDGSRIAFIPSDGIWTMGAGGEEPVRVDKDSTATYSSLAWGPSRRIAYWKWKATENASAFESIESLDVESGEVTEIARELQLRSGVVKPALKWMPDGRIIFAQLEAPPNSHDANLWQMKVDPSTGRASGGPTRLTSWNGFTITGLSASRDGKRLVYRWQRAQNDVYVGQLEAAGRRMSEPRRFTMDDRHDGGACWMQDSRGVLFNSDRNGNFDLYRQEIGQRTAELLLAGPEDELGPCASPDGNLILFLATSGQGSDLRQRLMRTTPSGGPAEEVVGEQNGRMSFKCPSPPATRCVLGVKEGTKFTFFALDPMRGKGPELGSVEADWSGSWSLSPDGSRIAFASGAAVGDIRIFNLMDGTTRRLQIGISAVPQWLAWSVGGDGLFVTGWHGSDSGWCRLWHVDLQGRAALVWQPMKPGDWVGRPAPSPDGRQLALSVIVRESNAAMLEDF